MRLRCSLWLSLSLIAGTADARGQEYSATFSKQQLPDGISVEGNATVDGTQNRPGGQGGSLRIAPETKVVWNLRDANGSGKAEFWVLDDGRSPNDPKLNRQVHSLAHVINSPTLVDVDSVTSSTPHTPVHTMMKRVDGVTYLFAVSLYHEETDATFDIRGLAAKATAKVIDESRSIAVTNGKLADHFGGYDVHLYRVD